MKIGPHVSMFVVAYIVCYPILASKVILILDMDCVKSDNTGWIINLELVS